jgi:serine/threonine protein kinase/dipeptidyl aminopeptidase/acylaminoacyl peptidase
MPLSSGSRLGPYEILVPLGAGGMGEVYKARDTRLGRTVALKVLPEHLTGDGELRQRFEREARTISQLSHPHICALYDVGHQDGTEYLVMEYLEGQTLSERLARGPLPVDQVLRYGIETADALHKAHRSGIVHRDLKPGNVMITASGVKLLDFGLARVLAPSGPDTILTALPTETPLTEKGAILGTVQYMAPEQLEGKDSDARTDVFALGAILYEMATGKKAFGGASHASLIGSILRDHPAPISQLQPIAPRALDRVVATCLAKDPEDRWQTARDVSIQLKGIGEEQSSPGLPRPVPAPRRRALALMPWIVAAAAVALGIYALSSGRRQQERPRVLRSYIPPPPNTTYHFFGANVGAPALSPDGRRIAFGVHEPDGSFRLWVRELDALDGYPLPGGEGGLFPFWSPDSRSIGFFAKGKLKVVEASPSPPPVRELADVVEARGGSWGADGSILFTPENFTALMRVTATGGAPVPATRLDSSAGDLAHRWPRFLPDGRRFLYEVRSKSPAGSPSIPAATYLSSLDGEGRRLVLNEGTSVTYVAPGYLLFRRANTLMAVACDPDSLVLKGNPVVLTDTLEGFSATGMSLFTAREDLLIYSPRAGLNRSRMVWLDRTGKELSQVGPTGQIIHFALSSDGREAVVAQIQEPLPPDVWIIETAAGRAIRLTRDSVAQVIPAISADGRIFYSSFATGPWDLWETTRQGESHAKPLLRSRATKSATDVSPDGRWLLYREFNTGSRGDLKALPLIGPPQILTVAATADDESNGDFSPDSQWVAYSSDESGRREIYVVSFPDPVRRIRVSSDGGSQPRWSRDGKELFYVQGGKLMAVAVSRQGEDVAFGESRPLFSLPLFGLVDPGFDIVTRYDVAPDGRFLALLRSLDEETTHLVLVQNWQETLKRQGP